MNLENDLLFGGDYDMPKEKSYKYDDRRSDEESNYDRYNREERDSTAADEAW